MNRATSKAAYRETRESGKEASQSEKIFNICKNGVYSMQEIMKIYRDTHGNIELSSISARLNKLKDDCLIIEQAPRKCSVTNKTINPVTIAGACTHEIYKKGRHMTATKALRMIQDKKIDLCWMGQAIQNCETCGADLTVYPSIVEVKTKSEYLRGLNFEK